MIGRNSKVWVAVNILLQASSNGEVYFMSVTALVAKKYSLMQAASSKALQQPCCGL